MQFFDTNVLVYRQDPQDPHRQQLAKGLIESAMVRGEFTISTQVLQEFYNTMLRRRFMPPAAAQALCEVWAEHDVVSTTAALVLRAFALQQRYQTSLWDALIVQAAIDAGCTTLYSEDLQHGMQFGALAVVNPFRADAVHEPATAYRAGPARRRKP